MPDDIPSPIEETLAKRIKFLLACAKNDEASDADFRSVVEEALMQDSSEFCWEVFFAEIQTLDNPTVN